MLFMTDDSSPGVFIRTQIFQQKTQASFAELIGCSQAEVSRFEKGERPFSARVQRLIQDKAKERGIAWDNNWFFKVPHLATQTTENNNANSASSFASPLA